MAPAMTDDPITIARTTNVIVREMRRAAVACIICAAGDGLRIVVRATGPPGGDRCYAHFVGYRDDLEAAQRRIAELEDRVHELEGTKRPPIANPPPEELSPRGPRTKLGG
jgi:hypothetical protein